MLVLKTVIPTFTVETPWFSKPARTGWAGFASLVLELSSSDTRLYGQTLNI